MEKKPIDIAHRILTHKLVILSAGILLALLAIISAK